MSNLIYSASKIQNNAKWPEIVTGKGQNHKIGNNSTNISIWSQKIGQT
jgi:hypothetical protein